MRYAYVWLCVLYVFVGVFFIFSEAEQGKIEVSGVCVCISLANVDLLQRGWLQKTAVKKR